MHRLLALIFLLCLGVGWHGQAHASGDVGCSPSWTLAHPDMSACDNMAVIGPGNDSRVNLLLLIGRPVGGDAPAVFFDMAGARAIFSPRPATEDASSYSDGEGSRCRSNGPGAAAFEGALGRSRVPARERDALIAARRALQPDCATEGKGAPGSTDIASAAGKEFAAYLDGAAAFYAADYDRAADRFRGLGTAQDAWLRETALYMLGRVEVNRAQRGLYDEYGSRNPDAKPEARVLASAEAGLRAYMRAYPRGAYFASARGLLRRVFWLARDVRRLEAEYAALLKMPAADRGLDDVALADEIDDKLLTIAQPEQLSDPLLLATLDLMRMRVLRDENGDVCCDAPMTREALDAQRGRFASMPALFTFLQAVYASYVGDKPAEVQRLIPDASHQRDFTYLEFSRQMLRGRALEAQRDRNARGFWIDLLPGAMHPGQRPAVELAIALHDERAGALARVFEPGSEVRTPAIREILLIQVADAALLRRQATASGIPAHERQVALFTLLYKEMTRGRYADLVRDLALVPAGADRQPGYYDLVDMETLPLGVFIQTEALGDYGCPALRETAAKLTGLPTDPKALLCLGDFVRATGFDDYPLDTPPPADELGGTPSLFPGKPFSRGEAYKSLIASPRTPPADKAYALYRAVMCYAPSRSNACGGTEVPQAQRRAWFQQLKRDYPQSRWATELRYYW